VSQELYDGILPNSLYCETIGVCLVPYDLPVLDRRYAGHSQLSLIGKLTIEMMLVVNVSDFVPNASLPETLRKNHETVTNRNLGASTIP